MKRFWLPAALVLWVLCGSGLAKVLSPAQLEELLAGRDAVCPRPLPFEQPYWRKAGRCRAARLQAGSDSTLRDDFPCNDDDAGGCAQRELSIGADPQGNFVLSWVDFRDGDADVWFQRFDANGSRIGGNERVNSDVSMGWQGDPAAAKGPDGRFLFCWQDRRQIGNSDLFCQRFDANGQRLGDNFRVSDSGVPGDQSMSSACTGPDGSSLLAWDDRRFGITGDIFAQFLAPDGSKRDTNFRVNDDQVGYANQYEPVVRGDDSGRYVVAWMDGRGLNPYDWNIFCQRFGPTGSRIGRNIRVTTNDSIQWAPGLAVAPSGAFLVCFDDRRNGRYDVYGQRFSSSGETLGGNFRMNDDAGSTDQYGADVAANDFGEWLAVWADRRNGDEDIYGQLYSASGLPVGSNFRIGEASSANQAGPCAAAGPAGGYWVAWIDSRDGNEDIYCQRLGRNGEPVGSSFRANDDQASSLQRCSSIGMASRGHICIGWEDERNGPTDIYCTVLDQTGEPLGPNRMVNDDGPGGAVQYYTAVAGGSDKFLVTWTDGRSNFNIYGQFLDGNGQPIGTNFRVNSGGVSDVQWYPYCAMDSANRAVVIWMDTRSLDFYQVFCRRYGPDGNPLGPEFTVADTNTDQVYASVAINPGGRFVVTWMDYRSGESDIYCQVFRPDGSRVGRNILVNEDVAGAYQGYPASAFAGDGRMVIAWEDTRNDDYDVFFQWFDSLGNRIGGNQRLTDGPQSSDYYSPSCAFDNTGRLVVTFNDEREVPGNPQIYCQRFAADTTRIGANRKLNRPNLFPKNHHWTVGQSVAVSESVVACAWTDNRRHQGFDIYAKLMDWELVDLEEAGQRLVANRRWVSPTISRTGRFTIECSPGARVRVSDAAGRLVLVQRPGPGLVELTGLSRGVYFARLEASRQSDCVKVVVE